MLRRERDLTVADNEPYFVSDETDYTIPQHGEVRRLPHVEIEIRQDLVKERRGRRRGLSAMAERSRRRSTAFWPATRPRERLLPVALHRPVAHDPVAGIDASRAFADVGWS